MLETYNKILKEIVDLINSYKENKINENNYYRIKQYFEIINKDTQNFYKYIKQLLSDNLKLHLLLLSIIYEVTRDEDSLIEASNIIIQDKTELDLEIKFGIRTQIAFNLAVNNASNQNYFIRRKIHNSLLLEFEKRINVNFQYIPLTIRNSNRIVIVTNQLLSDKHAPTSMIKDICFILQERLGIEVFLIVAPEKINVENLKSTWLSPRIMNYIEYDGYFTLTRNDIIIKGYQIIINPSNVTEIQQILKEVYFYNPLCIWYMGDLTFFADLCRKFTTVMSMPFSNGYAISEAQIMINYLNSHSKVINEIENYFYETNQIPLHYELQRKVRPSPKKYNRKDYGIEEDEFAITIVGNRLDNEITREFIIFLRNVLMINPKIKLIFIGKFNAYDSLFNDEFFFQRTKFLGFQNDLIGVISMMDLFLNPPRQGGGTGAFYSLFNGIPVVTLDDCDVANFIYKEDTCKNMKEMLDMIYRYVMERDYYNTQSKKAKRVKENRSDNIFAANTQKLLDKVKELIVYLESNNC